MEGYCLLYGIFPEGKTVTVNRIRQPYLGIIIEQSIGFIYSNQIPTIPGAACNDILKVYTKGIPPSDVFSEFASVCTAILAMSSAKMTVSPVVEQMVLPLFQNPVLLILDSGQSSGMVIIIFGNN